MKKLNSFWVFAGGIILGVGLTLCVGAADKETKTETAKADFSRVQMVTYASGVTGFFDAASGKVYLYDNDLKNCYQVRQLNALGEPMSRP